jgi:hypothetical protein
LTTAGHPAYRPRMPRVTQGDETSPQPGEPPVSSRGLGWSDGAALAVAGPYVIGVVVVNAYLAQFGPISLDLARPEYVLAGVLAVVLLSAGALLDTLIFFVALALRNWRARDWPILGRRLVGYVLLRAGLSTGLLLLRGQVAFQPIHAFRWFDPLFWRLLACSLPAAFTVGLASDLLRLDWRQGSVLDRFWSVVLEPHRAAHAMITVAFAAASVFGYATFVYPELAREFGGGRRPIVKLILKESLGAPSTASPVPISELVLGPGILLMETGDRYVVARAVTPLSTERGGAIALQKDLVRAVVYLK